MSTSRCPACRARLAPDDPLCPRCACDLRLVQRAQCQAEQHVALAGCAWAAGDAALAQTELDAALDLHRSPLALALQRVLRAESGLGDDGWAQSPKA